MPRYGQSKYGTFKYGVYRALGSALGSLIKYRLSSQRSRMILNASAEIEREHDIVRMSTGDGIWVEARKVEFQGMP